MTILVFPASNNNAENSNSLSPVIQEKLQGSSSTSSVATTENDQMLDSFVLVNDNEVRSMIASNENSVGISKVYKDMKNLSFKESDKVAESVEASESCEVMEVDANQHTTDGVQQGESVQNKTGDPPSGGCSNVEGQVDLENKGRIESLGHIPHSASIDIDDSQQSGQDGIKKGQSSADKLNQTHSAASAHQNCSTSEQDGGKHDMEQAVSVLGVNNKDEDDEKSSDMWVPPNETHAARPVEAMADAQNGNHECKMGDRDSRSGPTEMQSAQHSEQDSESDEMNEEDLEELDSDPDSNSEVESDKDNQAETGGSKPKKRKKTKKKGKEKYKKKKARKEKVKDVHKKENSPESISNQKVVKSDETAEKDKEKIAKQGESSKVGNSESSGSSLPANTTSPSTTSDGKGLTGPSPQTEPATLHGLSEQQGTSVDPPLTNYSGTSGYQNVGAFIVIIVVL